MTVTVLLFAQAKQIAGAENTEVHLADNSTVCDLKSALSAKHPEMADLVARSNIAIDQQYVTDQDIVTPLAEVAMIPPVSGG